MLVALLILVGSAVLLLFLILLTRRVLASQLTVPVEFLEELAGDSEDSFGSDDEFAEPGLQELDLIEPQVQEVISEVSDTVVAQAATLDAMLSDMTAGGTGSGDRRRAGKGGSNIVPRWERWEIRFSAISLDVYAKQLDFFRVELAVIGGGGKSIEYVSGFSRPRPEKRSSSAESEDRLYMTWRSGELKKADRDLLRKTGLDPLGRLSVQFYPPDVEQTLGRLERAYAGDRELKDIRRTRFGVRPDAKGYQFYVMEQTMR